MATIKTIWELDQENSPQSSDRIAIQGASGEDVRYATLIKILQTLSFQDTFDDDDLDGGYEITIEHSLGTDIPIVFLYDGDFNYVDLNGVLSITDLNNIKLSLGSSITGTWKVVVVNMATYTR